MDNEKSKAEVNSFVIYRSFVEAARTVTDHETRLQIYEAIFDYGFDGVEPEAESADDILRALFMMAKPNIDAAKRRRDASRKNGMNGGRPKNGGIKDAPEAIIERAHELAEKIHNGNATDEETREYEQIVAEVNNG